MPTTLTPVDIADRLDAWASKIEAMTPDLINEVAAAREAAAEIRRLRAVIEQAEQQMDYGQTDAAHGILIDALPVKGTTP